MDDWRTFDIANPTEEHAMIREMVRDFAREEVEPQALEYDRDEKFNLELFRMLGEYGLLGITITGDAFNIFVFLEISPRTVGESKDK